MNSKIFNKNLYMDGLKQLKTVGIIFSLLSIFISLIYPVVIFFNKLNSSQYSQSETMSAPYIGFSAPSLYIVMFLGSIIFVMSAFSFLNKRNASDFYHSLPNTRFSTLFSLTCSVLTWLYSIIISTVLIVWLAFTVLGLPFNALHVPYLLTMFIVGTTLVVSATLLATSITGTGLSTFAVTAIILYVPRIIMSVFTVTLLLTTNSVPANSLNLFFNQSINIPYGFSLGLFMSQVAGGTDPIIQMYSSISTYVYSLILAVAYFALAAFLFYKRKSETAEKSAPNKILQHIYRLGVTLPVLLIISMIVGANNTNLGSDIMYLMSTFITIVIIAFIINCTYELITTKRFMNVLKSIPLFLVAVGFVFGLGYISKVTTNTIASKEISAENLEYIKILGTKADQRSSNYINTYSQVNIANIKLTDLETLKKISSTYNTSISQHSYGYAIPMEIKEKGSLPYSRILLIDYTDNEDILSDLMKNSDFQQALRKLPDDNEIISMRLGDETLTKQQQDELWKIYKDEINAISTEDYINMGINSSSSTTNTIAYFRPNIKSGISNYTVNYPISSLVPKTAKAYVDFCNESAAGTTGILAKIDKYKSIYDDAPANNGLGITFLVIPSENKNGTAFPPYSLYADAYSSDKALESTTAYRKDNMTDTDILIDDALSIVKLIGEPTSEFDIKKSYIQVSTRCSAPVDILENPSNLWRSYNSHGGEVNFADEHLSYYVNVSEETLDQMTQIIIDRRESLLAEK